MAVRWDASADNLRRTTNLPTITSFTVMGWLYIVSGSTYNMLCAFGASATGGNYHYLGGEPSSHQLECGNPTLTQHGSVLTVGQWYHLALTVAGTGTNQVLVYLNGVMNITNNGSASPTATQLMLGNTPDGDFGNHRLAAIKVYNTVLTASEIQQEMRCYLPVRTLNLNTWSPLMAATDVGNYAGTGAWTVGGTLTTEDGPPISWSLRPGAMAFKRHVVAPATKAPPPGRRPWRFVRRAA